jgi:hypothetical protein
MATTYTNTGNTKYGKTNNMGSRTQKISTNTQAVATAPQARPHSTIKHRSHSDSLPSNGNRRNKSKRAINAKATYGRTNHAVAQISVGMKEGSKK